ncbi:hypothetical protein J1N35_011279, partial [Gossypium stocksii]
NTKYKDTQVKCAQLEEQNSWLKARESSSKEKFKALKQCHLAELEGLHQSNK